MALSRHHGINDISVAGWERLSCLSGLSLRHLKLTFAPHLYDSRYPRQHLPTLPALKTLSIQAWQRGLHGRTFELEKFFRVSLDQLPELVKLSLCDKTEHGPYGFVPLPWRVNKILRGSARKLRKLKCSGQMLFGGQFAAFLAEVSEHLEVLSINGMILCTGPQSTLQLKCLQILKVYGSTKPFLGLSCPNLQSLSFTIREPRQETIQERHNLDLLVKEFWTRNSAKLESCKVERLCPTVSPQTRLSSESRFLSK